MLTVHAALHLAMVVSWLLAACTGSVPLWSRWVLLAMAIPVSLATRASAARTTRVAPVLLPVAMLVMYGLALSLLSRNPPLALVKCSVFGATAWACLAGGASLVERFGRDKVLAMWRLAWRGLLGLSVLAVLTGVWTSAGGGLYGPTGNPNMFGTLLASTGVILFLPPLAGQRRGPAFYAEVAVGLALLLATRCRSAMLGVAVASAVVVLSGRGSRRWLWTAAILAAGGAMLVAVPKATVERVEDVLRKTPLDQTAGPAPAVLATRMPIWEESWNAMIAGLPFGFGWGVKQVAPREWVLDVQSLGYGREEGTSWLPVGEELGVPGLALVAWLWILLFRRVRYAPSRIQPLAYAVLSTLFVIASFEGWFLTPGNWESMAFWTSVGVLFARPAVAGLPVPSVPAPRGASVAAPLFVR